jgi:hypothetical protein
MEGANAHAEAAAAREALLQVKVEAATEVQRVKTAMALQEEKDMVALRKELEVAQQKAKDATDDLQAVVDGTFILSLSIVFLWLGLFSISVFDTSRRQGDGGEALKKELSKMMNQVKVLKERTKEVREGER